MKISPFDPDLNAIAVDLARLDVPYLRIIASPAPSQTSPPPIAPETLIRQLAQHGEPRLREALIPLFLRHPDYHRCVPALALSLDSQAAQTLRHFYTAAVYLQHLWRSTLGLYLGAFPDLPNYFGETEFGLPSPQLHWGEVGLRLLAARFEAETGDNWLTTYEGAMSRFLAQQQLQIDAVNP